MGLKGNLATFSLGVVFQALSSDRSTGLLRIQDPEGTRFVEIQDGAISIVSRSASRVPLGDLLAARGLLNDEGLKQALTRQKETGKLLGEVLMDLGLLKGPDLEAALRFQIEEEICELFLLKAGDFDFLANASLDATMALGGGFMRLKIDANGLLMEAARRVDEWRRVEERIPRQALVFQLTAAGKELLTTKQGLSFEGQTLLQLVRSHRSVEAMVHKACLGRLNTNLLLVELWDAGLIQPVPAAEYVALAQEHFEAGRVDEAERVAAYALPEEPDPVRKDLLRKVLAEVEKKKRLAAGTESSAAARVRSEVIRRQNPALIIRSRSSRGPWLAAALVLALAGGGAAWWFFLRPVGTVLSADQQQWEALAQHVDELISEGHYAEALKQLERRFRDPDVQRASGEMFNRAKAFMDSDLQELLVSAGNAFESGEAAEVEKAIAHLRRFDGVNIFTEARYADLRGLRERARQWSQTQAAGKFQQRLKALGGKDAEALAEELPKLLAADPPEVVAADIRDRLAELAERKRKARAALQSAQVCEELGLWRDARGSYEKARDMAPGSDLARKAQERLAIVTERSHMLEQKLYQIGILWTQDLRDKARAEIRSLLETREGADPTRAGREKWREYNPSVDGETKAEQLLAEAGRLGAQGQETAARQKKLEVLTQYPYSLTASKVELKVKVDSRPRGAKVAVNGKTQGWVTPALVSVPGLGLARLSFSKPGYAVLEVPLYDFREETYLAPLMREPVERPRRLPGPAANGLAGLNDWVVLTHNGELVGVDLSRPSREPLVRVVLEDRAAGRLGQAWLLPAEAGQPPEALVATDQPRFWRLALPKGSPRAAGLGGTPLLPPLVCADKALANRAAGPPGRFLLAAITSAGLECYDLSDDRARFQPRRLSPAENAVPRGWAGNGARFFVACADGKLYSLDAEGGHPWEAELPPECVGAPACHLSNKVAALGAHGRLVVWDAETGTVHGQRDLGAKYKLGPVACAQGFAVIPEVGRLQLVAPGAERVLWAQDIPPGVALPAVPSGDRYLALAAPEEVLLLELASGEVAWRAPLDSPPVALEAAGKRLFISTAAADLWVFDTE